MYLRYLFLATSSFSAASAVTVDKRNTYYISTSLPSGWTYQGCYSDSISNRVLSGASEPNPNIVTQEYCIEYCSQTDGGYSFAGVEYGKECYCGHQLASSSAKEADTDCYMPCAGNSSESCGGPNRLNLFSTGISPATNPGPSGWKSLGCYSDSTNSRTLKNAESIPGGVTVAKCTAKCQQIGYLYAGVEYGVECYCDDQIQNNASPLSSGCSMACAGNSSEYCGGANSLNLYQSSSVSGSASLPSGWSPLGCWTDSVSARTLGNQFSNSYQNMTIEACLGTCQIHGYSLAGLEYAQECYCDNKINNQGQCASDSDCDMHCVGNPAEICGGSNRLNMYELGSGVVASCSTSQSSSAPIQTPSTSGTGQTSSPATSLNSATTTTSIVSSPTTPITSNPSNPPNSPAPTHAPTTVFTSTTSSTSTSHTSTVSSPGCVYGAPCNQAGTQINSCCPNSGYVLRCTGQTLGEAGSCQAEEGDSQYGICTQYSYSDTVGGYCTTMAH